MTDDYFLKTLAEGLKSLGCLLKLDLSNNYLSDETAETLADYLKVFLRCAYHSMTII